LLPGLSKVAVDQVVGAQRLDHVDLDLERVAANAQIFGAHAELRGAPASAGTARGKTMLAPSTCNEAPSAATVALSRFIGGEPMKLATNAVAGRA